jgi:hypothetical protein
MGCDAGGAAADGERAWFRGGADQADQSRSIFAAQMKSLCESPPIECVE